MYYAFLFAVDVVVYGPHQLGARVSTCTAVASDALGRNCVWSDSRPKKERAVVDEVLLINYFIQLQRTSRAGRVWARVNVVALRIIFLVVVALDESGQLLQKRSINHSAIRYFTASRLLLFVRKLYTL